MEWPGNKAKYCALTEGGVGGGVCEGEGTRIEIGYYSVAYFEFDVL